MGIPYGNKWVFPIHWVPSGNLTYPFIVNFTIAMLNYQRVFPISSTRRPRGLRPLPCVAQPARHALSAGRALGRGAACRGESSGALERTKIGENLAVDMEKPLKTL